MATLEPVTADQIARVRQQYNMGMNEARRLALKINLERFIDRAKDMDDIKVALKATLKLIG